MASIEDEGEILSLLCAVQNHAQSCEELRLKPDLSLGDIYQLKKELEWIDSQITTLNERAQGLYTISAVTQFCTISDSIGSKTARKISRQRDAGKIFKRGLV